MQLVLHIRSCLDRLPYLSHRIVDTVVNAIRGRKPCKHSATVLSLVVYLQLCKDYRKHKDHGEQTSRNKNCIFFSSTLCVWSKYSSAQILSHQIFIVVALKNCFSSGGGQKMNHKKKEPSSRLYQSGWAINLILFSVIIVFLAMITTL